MDHNTVNNTRYRTRNHSARIVNAVSHRVTAAHFNRNLVLLLQLHQLQAERDHISVYIRARDIFKVASWADADLQALFYDAQIMLHCLTACHLHLIKNVVIRAAYENTGFLHTDVAHEFKVLLISADPACDLRKLISSLHTFVHRISVLFAVQKEFTLTHFSVRTSQAVQIVINRHDLLCGIRSAGLLPIAESSIRNPDFLRHMVRYNTVIECNLRNL